MAGRERREVKQEWVDECVLMKQERVDTCVLGERKGLPVCVGMRGQCVSTEKSVGDRGQKEGGLSVWVLKECDEWAKKQWMRVMETTNHNGVCVCVCVRVTRRQRQNRTNVSIREGGKGVRVCVYERC